MDRFIFANAYDHLSADATANDPSSDLPLRIAFVATMPSRTDEFAVDLDEVAATNYARFVVNGGRYTGNPVSGGIEVTGTSVTPIADVGDSGDPTTVAGWVLLRHTGSDATAYLIAASDELPAEFQLLDGDDIAPEFVGAVIDGTWERVTTEGGTAATTTASNSGHAYLTGTNAQDQLDQADAKFVEAATAIGSLSVTVGGLSSSKADQTDLDTTNGNVADIDDYLFAVHTGPSASTITIDPTHQLHSHDLSVDDSPIELVLPEMTSGNASFCVIDLKCTEDGDVDISFVSDGSGRIDWFGPEPTKIPASGTVAVLAYSNPGATGIGGWNMYPLSRVNGWGMSGTAATVSSGTFSYSEAVTDLEVTGDITLTRAPLTNGVGPGEFLLCLRNTTGASKTLTWTSVTWHGTALTTLAAGDKRLVMVYSGDGATFYARDLSAGGGLSAPVALSDLATQADQTIVGNNTGGTAAPIALTASQTRTVLGLGGAALLAVGTTAGTVAAGDDSRITGAVPKSTVTAKGDLIVATASGAVTNLAVGTAGQGLVPDTSASGGVAWGSPSSMRNRLLRPTGAIAESIERTNIAASGLSASSGRMYAVAVAIPRQTVVTSITFTSVAASTGLTNHWFGLYDASGNQLRLTADNTTTAWSANDPRTLNLSSTYTTGNSDALYYLVVMQNGSGPATLAQSAATAPASGVVNIAPVLGGRDSGSSYTNPASAPSTFTLSANIGICLYAYCS